jgi:hypothetical protein
VSKLLSFSTMTSRALVVATSLVVCACGSRSGLSTAAGGFAGISASGGGTTSVGGTSSGGSGGLGGVVAGGSGGLAGAGGENPCAVLTPLDPIVSVERAPTDDDRAPGLAYFTSDHDSVAVAFGRADPSAAVRGIGTAVLKPWGSWLEPASIEATIHTTDPVFQPQLGSELRTGDSVSGRLVVLAGHVSAGAFSIYEVDLDSGPLPAPGYASSSSMGFVTRGTSGYHLVGTYRGAGAAHWMEGLLVGTPPTSIHVPMGCAASPVVSDAVAYEEGWLVATSTSPGFAPEICTFGDPQAPTRIDVVYATPDSKTETLLGLQEAEPIQEIVAVPHPSGVSVLWRAVTDVAVPPIRFARFDVVNQIVVGPIDITGPGAAPLPGFDAVALGDTLAVAWGNDPAGNPPDIVLSVFDQNGNALAEATLPDRFHVRLSALPSDDGKSTLVSWEEPSGDGLKRVRIARFDCGGP